MPRPRLFADEVTTCTVAELRSGDFLVEVLPHRNVRGVRVESGVTALEEDYTWGERTGRRGVCIPVEARRFQTLRGVPLSLPSAATCTVRRRLAPLPA